MADPTPVPLQLCERYSCGGARSVDLDQGVAGLATVQLCAAVLFRFDLIEIPMSDAFDLQALGAKAFPQFLLIDGQPAAAAAEFFPLLSYKDKLLMSARCHGPEDIGSGSGTQTLSP